MTDTNTQIQKAENLAVGFFDAGAFAHMQRVAKMFSSSQLVPQQFQGEAGIPNCVIALEMSQRIGASPLAIMQNIYIVHGKPAWSSQFLIACVNSSHRFSPMRFRQTGERGTDSWGCVAWALDQGGEKLESPEVNINMAKKEGWVSKNGSKWLTMPELMLRYRAATLFARLYAPELTMGIRTDDEVLDVEAEVMPMPEVVKIGNEGASEKPTLGRKKRATSVDVATPDHVTGETAPISVPESTAANSVKPPPVAETAKPEPAAPPTPAQSSTDDMPPVEFVEKFCADNGVSFDDFRDFLGADGHVKDSDSLADWTEVPTHICKVFVDEYRKNPASKLAQLNRVAKVYGTHS